MTFEIKSDRVDVQEVMREIRRRIEEKKRSLYTEEEIREIAERPLHAVLSAHEFQSQLLTEFLGNSDRWNFSFGPETMYVSSRGLTGRILETFRRLLRPIQKLFWNPNPMISALSRQSDLNTSFVHVLHNVAQEMTRLNLEVQDLKNRVLQLQGRLEFHARREKTLESLMMEGHLDTSADRKVEDGGQR